MKVIFKRFIYLTLSVLILIFIIYVSNYDHSGPMPDKFITIITDKPDHEEVIQVKQLVNLVDFDYIIKADVCQNNDDGDILGIIIITSYVGHDEIRSAHRQAISQKKLKAMGLLRVFLLADIPAHEKYITQEALYNEYDRFNDIVQGNFIESYHNLTYKHVMGLRWASIECSSAKFIIKIDDDIVFDVFFVQNYLSNLIDNTVEPNMYLAGFILDNKKPIRNVASKWYVSERDYQRDIYPDYLSGWLYITNPKTALKLVIESRRQPFMWIDDTWVTGILREKQRVNLTRLNSWFSANSQFLDCCIDDIERYSFKCDYHVGPNGGDTKLLQTFMNSMEKCFIDDVCTERTPDKSLTQTCVGKSKDLVEAHGDAVVHKVNL